MMPNPPVKKVSRRTQINLTRADIVKMLKFCNPHDLDIQAMPESGPDVSVELPQPGLVTVAYTRSTP